MRKLENINKNFGGLYMKVGKRRFFNNNLHYNQNYAIGYPNLSKNNKIEY